MKITHILGAATLASALVFGACTAGNGGGGGYDETSYSAEDCDAEDLANFEDDCGYWDANGVFVYWYWVGPYGGYRPAGWTPYYPPGSHRTRPPNANTKAKPTTQSRPAGAPTASVPKKAPGTIACQAFEVLAPPPPKPPAPKPPAPKPITPKAPTPKAPTPKASTPTAKAPC